MRESVCAGSAQARREALDTLAGVGELLGRSRIRYAEVRALSEALRAEVAQYNIGVTVICPGVVRTNIFNALKIKGYSAEVRRMPSYAGITPEAMADRMISAIKHNRAMVVTGIGKVGYYLKRLSPALAERLGRWGMEFYSKYKEEDK